MSSLLKKLEFSFFTCQGNAKEYSSKSFVLPSPSMSTTPGTWPHCQRNQIPHNIICMADCSHWWCASVCSWPNLHTLDWKQQLCSWSQHLTSKSLTVTLDLVCHTSPSCWCLWGWARSRRGQKTCWTPAILLSCLLWKLQIIHQHLCFNELMVH